MEFPNKGIPNAFASHLLFSFCWFRAACAYEMNRSGLCPFSIRMALINAMIVEMIFQLLLMQIGESNAQLSAL